MTQTQAVQPSRKSEAHKYPIVYLRGYAGTTDGINTMVDDPFYGFNTGATHVRVDGDGDPSYYQFEGPLLRLITEQGYKLLVSGDQRALLALENATKLDPASIWVFRFYDAAATTFHKEPKENLLERFVHDFHRKVSADNFNIEIAAEQLYLFIMDVLRRTEAEKVVLVAHSMGGLVARCMMQKICQLADDTGPRRPARDFVDKFFTYGTPHGGIVTDLRGLNMLEEFAGPAGSEIFSPPRMYNYLNQDRRYDDKPPDDEDARYSQWDPRKIPEDIFDVQNVFCIVGTDPSDYGLSRLVVGPQSDGLVRMQNAYVKGAHRAYIYKSHSGRYGEVNSEEGYQNLKRFLFGRWEVSLTFIGLPKAAPTSNWQTDMLLSIRGVPIVMSEQRAAHWCPIILNKVVDASDDQGRQNVTDDEADAPIPIVSTFLLEAEPPSDPAALDAYVSRYVITLKVYEVVDKDGMFDFTSQIEGVGDWTDSLVVDVGAKPGDPQVTAWTGWNSLVDGQLKSAVSMPNELTLEVDTDPKAPQGQRSGEIELPRSARALPIFGPSASLRVTVRQRAMNLAPLGELRS